jgi:CDGSH-type Zn-finger protein/truncated hemoglobin YjbI/ferredoxin
LAGKEVPIVAARRPGTEAILGSLHELLSQLTTEPQPDLPLVSRLRDSVIRPIEQVDDQALEPPQLLPSGELDVTAPDLEPRPVQDQLWELARSATAIRARNPGLLELAEAAAAIQDVTLSAAVSDEVAEDRRRTLAALQSGLPAQIQAMPNGPYLVTNPTVLRDWLGQSLPIRPQMALCRCGGSALKPLCDGSHVRIGFSDAKDPNRVPDRGDRYPGQQIDILDNRGTCQHAGYCSDRLATVFHAHDEPFVTASGGRMDEIIRAVRDCPSGALSYAIDGVEARDDVDYHGTRPPEIAVTKDGPYRVTGGVPLVDHQGMDVHRNQGASLEHYALCRCGHSQNKPFCSGMHYYVEFHDPIAGADHRSTIFEWAGGLPALTRMTRQFYEKHVPQDPLLAPLFATMSPEHPQRVAKWLAEVFCGPTLYSSEYGGYPRMLSQHLGKSLSEGQRARWVALLLQSAREAGLPNDAEFRSAFGAYIEWGSRLAVENSQTDARPPERMPMPRWDWNTAAGPPGSRISALASTQPEERPMKLPAENEPVSFEAHVKPLFRSQDQRSMSFAFDLRSYDDVSSHADAIASRLRAGTMPCDGAWPQEWVALFQRWVELGKPR